MLGEWAFCRYKIESSNVSEESNRASLTVLLSSPRLHSESELRCLAFCSSLLPLRRGQLQALCYRTTLLSPGSFFTRFTIMNSLSECCLCRVRCSTTISDEKIAQMEQDFQTKMAERGGTRTLAAAASTVSVYWHVISKDSTTAGGNIP